MASSQHPLTARVYVNRIWRWHFGVGLVGSTENFGLLGDREEAPDESLPDTGVGLATERWLSSAFIAVEGYGTRSSTVLSISRDGEAQFTERTYLQSSAGDRQPEHFETRSHRIPLASVDPVSR